MKAKAPRKGKAKKKPAAIEPSHIRGHVTAARMGRPSKLTRALITAFLGHLALGLHLQHCGALCGVTASHLSEWLRTGRADELAGRRSLAADFSAAVRAKLADLQRQELGSLAVYQRMAEGWEPTCRACTTKGGPCGKHPQNLRLAADLARWRLVHRFPKEWNVSTVQVGLDGGDDTGHGGASEEGAARPAVAAMVMWIPRRNDPM